MCDLNRDPPTTGWPSTCEACGGGDGGDVGGEWEVIQAFVRENGESRAGAAMGGCGGNE